MSHRELQQELDASEAGAFAPTAPSSIASLLVAPLHPGVGHQGARTGAGRRDTFVPPVNAEFPHERLPKSKLDIIDAGHFTWEDAANDFAAIVSSWWGGGYTKDHTSKRKPQ